MFDKLEKGQYEYAKYTRNKLLIYTLGLYGLSAAIYLMGLITTKSNKNLLTIVAVLGILPASKMLISFIMSCRVQTLPTEIKEEIDEASKSMNGFYNLYFTSYEENYYIGHCVITSDSLIGYSNQKDFDGKKFNEHLEKHMKIEGISNMLIKIFDNKDAYINRLSQLSMLEQSKDTNSKMAELVKNITL